MRPAKRVGDSPRWRGACAAKVLSCCSRVARRPSRSAATGREDATRSSPWPLPVSSQGTLRDRAARGWNRRDRRSDRCRRRLCRRRHRPAGPRSRSRRTRRPGTQRFLLLLQRRGRSPRHRTHPHQRDGSRPRAGGVDHRSRQPESGVRRPSERAARGSLPRAVLLVELLLADDHVDLAREELSLLVRVGDPVDAGRSSPPGCR